VNLAELTDDDLIRLMTVEMMAYDTPLEFVLRPQTAIELAGLLQLAARHPDLPPTHRQTARAFVEHVRTYFRGAPAVTEALRRGEADD
jgi:hypothetical protein